MTTPILALEAISKRYGAVTANDGIDLTVTPGEIHALLGENGAGKSTLVKIVMGVVQPDAGQLVWQGRAVTIPDPRVARRLGIGMVFQHFSLFEALSVLENVALGMDGVRADRALAQRIRAVSESYGLPIEPDRPVHSLSVGERQRIEVVRCLLQESRLLIMDEPTSVLTPQEVERLFATLRALAAEGCAVLYISHKLEEVRELCDRATVLRQGRVVARCDPRRESARSLAAMMIGTEVGVREERRARDGARPTRLTVRGLELATAGQHDIPLRGVGLEVGAGEIVGIAGVAGNGQRELAEALVGERAIASGAAIALDGRAIERFPVPERRRLGLCYVPEERNGTGAVPGFTLVDNTVLGAWARARLTTGGMLRSARARALAASVVERFDVRTSGVEAVAASLSGGNLQKFIMGREVLQEPRLLIAAQPTWGVDAGAAARIHDCLQDLAAAGAGILLISQDLDEIMALCDRLHVLNAGRLSDAVIPADVTVAEIGLLMGGLHDLPPPESVPLAVHP